MAINYLNSIDLNKNELLQGGNRKSTKRCSCRIISSNRAGILQHSDFELRQYNGTAWVSVGDITSLTPGTNISIDNPSTSSPTINVVDAPTFAGNLTISKNQPVLIINDTVASDLKLEIKQSASTTVFKSRGGTSSTGQFNFQITNGSTTTNALFINQQARATFAGDVVINGGDITLGGTGRIQGVDTVTDGTDATNKTYVDNAITAAAYTFDIGADTGTDQGVASGDIVDIAGSANIGTAVSIVNSKPTVTVSLGDSVSIGGDFDADGDGSFGGDVSIEGDLSMNSRHINDLLDPSVAQDAATKNYVDNAIVGGLVYQGGYNAATNTPNLDSNPSPNPIKQGWTYTVTADGLFFTEQVRVGDVLIAEQDAPTALADWTTAQNNVDLADLTTVGLGNVNAGEAIDVSYSNGTATVSVENSTASNKGAVIVAPGGAIDVSYTSGTATVSVEDSTASNKGAVIVAGGTGISVAYSNGTATVTNTETNADNSYAVTITDTATITHSLGTKDVMIQLYDVTTNETVYADVERGSTTQATITFASTPTNSIRVLVQKIG